MNCPLQSGHEPPQPWAEPVFVTSAPITRTTNMPHALTTESHLRMRYIRLCRPRLFQSSPARITGCNQVQPTLAARLPEAWAVHLPFRVYRAAAARGSTTRILRSRQWHWGRGVALGVPIMNYRHLSLLRMR